MIYNLDRDWSEGRDLRAYTADHEEITGAVWLDTETGLVCRVIFGKNVAGHTVVEGRDRLISPGCYAASVAP